MVNCCVSAQNVEIFFVEGMTINQLHYYLAKITIPNRPHFEDATDLIMEEEVEIKE